MSERPEPEAANEEAFQNLKKFLVHPSHVKSPCLVRFLLPIFWVFVTFYLKASTLFYYFNDLSYKDNSPCLCFFFSQPTCVWISPDSPNSMRQTSGNARLGFVFIRAFDCVQDCLSCIVLSGELWHVLFGKSRAPRALNKDNTAHNGKRNKSSMFSRRLHEVEELCHTPNKMLVIHLKGD